MWFRFLKESLGFGSRCPQGAVFELDKQRERYVSALHAEFRAAAQARTQAARARLSQEAQRTITREKGMKSLPPLHNPPLNYTLRFTFAPHASISMIKSTLKSILGLLPPDWKRARRHEVVVHIREDSYGRAIRILYQRRRLLISKKVEERLKREMDDLPAIQPEDF